MIRVNGCRPIGFEGFARWDFGQGHMGMLRVESSSDEESLGEDASKQGRRIDADEDITLVSVQDDGDKERFDVDTLGGVEVFVAGQNENVVEEVVDDAQDKGKGIMIEEHVKPKKKYLIRLDEEAAKKFKAECDEEERLARERAKKEQEANIALIETWDDIQAKIDADHQLAERLIKSLLDAVGITAAQVCVNTAQLELMLLVKVNTAGTKVNAASESIWRRLKFEEKIRSSTSLRKVTSQDLIHVVILKRVEDLQLGVKIYQKKNNITRPEYLGPTSPKELYRLHTKILKELSM
nr:hypothetical protein [Tanacetum cinerariifolium]